MMRWVVRSLCVFLAATITSSASSQDAKIGLFEGSVDIGEPGIAGSVVVDATTGRIAVKGGGENMWFARDELHLAWKKVSGNVSLSASIRFPEAGGDPHRKAVVMIRESLDTGSVYADAAIHGDGLCSLQYRDTTDGATHEVQALQKSPQRLSLERRGEFLIMLVGESASDMQIAGSICLRELKEPFYVGLGVCAHNDARIETAEFSDVAFHGELSATPQDGIRSTLETISIASTDRRVVLQTSDHIEAPNWSPDGQRLLFNSEGGLFAIATTGGEVTRINTGTATRLNNDHGISADGTRLVISDQTRSGGSRIYTLPIAGGEPKLVLDAAPSYWHGWSPDGRTLAYCAERNDEYDIYTVPVEGGTETRLTSASGLDDGPDYSADGAWIYFNSDRTGRMHIWKMKPDGSRQTQVTSDDQNNWFPHPSPDGQWLVFLSYDKEVEGHPENKHVRLRLMPIAGGDIRTIANLYGGQGTINVPSWSPDSRQVAFVSYQPVFE